MSGDALRIDVMKNLFSGKEKLAQTKGLTLYGSQPAAGGGMMGPRGPAKTTVLLGLRGLASIRDDLRWAEVFSRQGIGFILLDKPEVIFGDGGLSDEGKRILEALGKANLLLIVKGLNPAQAKALLENSKKPVILQMDTLPDRDILDLVKKTESAVGLVLGKGEDAASFVKKIDAAKKAIGTEYLSIVNENCLWQNAGKEQMLNVIAALLKAKFEIEELANLFSGTFTRALNRATRQ
jgi:microsomal dipeptidase-like Zn-dependent dipeptidase